MAEEKRNWLGPYIPQGNVLRDVIQQIKLLYYLMTDRRVHPVAKLIPVAAVVVIFSPLNIIPDFIPVVGQLDDAAILMLGMRLFFEVVPPALVREHLQRLTRPVTDEEWQVAFTPPEGAPPPASTASNAASEPEDVIEGEFKDADDAEGQDAAR
jgi:uncharacterized membrane protein YkvA (DUF1232 family)